MKRLGLIVHIGATPATVFTALTDPAAMTVWLDEFAEVDLSRGVYDFWGRYSPQPERGRKRLLSAESGRSLQFNWRIGDAETTVTIQLEPEGDAGTRLVMTQVDLPERAGAEPFVMDFWRFSLDNLANDVEGLPLAARRPIDVETQIGAQAEVEIAASPEEVFASLMEPEQLSRWVGGQASVEPWVGGRYDFGWDHGPIKILELEPNTTLAYSWNYAETGETVVRWELAGSAGGTKLTLVHSGFAKKSDSDGYQLGWQAFMVGLQRMHALGSAWQRSEMFLPS